MDMTPHIEKTETIHWHLEHFNRDGMSMKLSERVGCQKLSKGARFSVILRFIIYDSEDREVNIHAFKADFIIAQFEINEAHLIKCNEMAYGLIKSEYKRRAHGTLVEDVIPPFQFDYQDLSTIKQCIEILSKK